MMKKVLIAGGSGLIGSRLTKLLLKNNYEVAWLSRGKRAIHGVQLYHWDIDKQEIDITAVLWADAIIHLAGAGIADEKWTEKRKSEIINSRVKSIALLRNTMISQQHSIQCIIASSAVGFYGDRDNDLLTETSASGDGFLSSSVAKWENAIDTFADAKVRLVKLRFGIVLSENGGALPELKKTLPIGVAPLLGNGKQLYPWIHIDDIAGFILFALQQENVVGLYNVTANVNSQKQIMQSLQSVYNTFSVLIPVPVFVLRIMLGEMADTVLVSQNVSNKKMMDTGYDLQFSDLKTALQQIKNSHT